jgi:hypothetical protein
MKTPLAILAEIGVPNLIAGGNAVQIYGYSRFTKDFDCVISMESADVMRTALEAAGFQVFDKNNVVIRYRALAQPSWILDTILVNEQTFAKMWTGRRIVKLGNSNLTVVAPLHLVGMKLHALKSAPDRLHDLIDILELLKRDLGNWKIEEVKELCEKYGPPGIFETMLPHLEQ